MASHGFPCHVIVTGCVTPAVQVRQKAKPAKDELLARSLQDNGNRAGLDTSFE